ncbi:hypothetical protein OF83DRAFT_1122148 [Amylostereum chailletii]|nr:hypothetical protein OF83DRAFT_1122148 [Amylostereum chailletii]
MSDKVELPIPFIGPKPIEEFIDTFLPNAKDDGWVPDGLTEPPQSPNHFVHMLENWARLCDTLVFTENEPPAPPGLDGVLMPPRGVICAFHHSDDSDDSDASGDADDVDDTDEPIPRTYRQFWSKAELVIVQRTLEEDPFVDPIYPNNVYPRKEIDFEVPFADAAQTRADLFMLADTQFKHQPRSFAFSVLVLDDYARLLRWDHTAVVVSELFPWVHPSSPLFVFLSIFHDLAAERGWDLTVSVPSKAEADLARAVFRKFAADIKVGSDEPLERVSICDEHVLVVPARRLRGRGLGTERRTIGRLAVNVCAGTLVLWKDGWRTVAQGAEGQERRCLPEFVAHKILEVTRVPGATPMLCGGDVPGQRTLSQEHAAMDWACGMGDTPLVARQRHWVVLAKKVRGMSTFKSTHELAQTVFGALRAHSQLQKEGQVHGDISPYNILIRDS